MALNVYETLAHALVQEHCRTEMLGRHYTYGGHTTLRSAAWRWLLIAYGKKLYDLPKEMGLVRVSGGPFGFATYGLAQSMSVGVSPLELYSYPTMSEFGHTYTPIHIATALLKYGNEEAMEVAKMMLTPAFLKKTYPSRTAEDFILQATPNPYSPESLGLQPFEMEDFLHEGKLQTVDEIGNAAWFSSEYTARLLRPLPCIHWYGRLKPVHAFHGLWGKLMEDAGFSLLHSVRVGSRRGYKDTVGYLRECAPDTARSFLEKQTGVAEILWATRGDATAKEMTKGLRAMLSGSSGPIVEARESFIGRALTYEDVEPLPPGAALTLLHSVSFESIADLVKKHHEELAAKFFVLSNRDRIHSVIDSLAPHKSRSTSWLPDTKESNYRLRHDSTPESYVQSWEQSLLRPVDFYCRAKKWRDRFILLAEPAVLLLALMRWKSKPTDPLPHQALENTLRCHPNIQEIQNVLAEMPRDIDAGAGL